MNQPASEREPASRWAVTGTAAREALRTYRAQFVAHSRPVQPFTADNGGDLTEDGDSRSRLAEAPVPEAPPIDAAALPDAILRLMREFRDQHQGAGLTPIRYLTIGTAGYTVAGNGELPAEENLVVFSVTETVASSGSLSVTAHVLATESGGPGVPSLD